MYQLYKRLISEIISFKSISTDSQYNINIKKTSKWLEAKFNEFGFDVKIIENYGNPIVFAEYKVSTKAQTALVYGHYDVQPADISEGWQTEPFELHDDGERLFARGIVDNKGQFVVHMASIFSLIEQNKLKYNIKFILEGEEEIGSQHFEKFLADKKDYLKSDFAILSDGETVADHPAIDASFRGIVNFSLKLTTSSTELHSGLVGGTVPNAALELSKLLGKILRSGGVKLESFYDSNIEIPTHIIENNKKVLQITNSNPLDITKTKKLVDVDELDYITKRSMKPSMEITTLKAGYLGEGYKNAVPAWAQVKFNIRTSPFQDPVKVYNNLVKDISKIADTDIYDIEFNFDQTFPGVILDITQSGYKKIQDLLTEVYNNEAIFNYNGAIIPIVVILAQEFKIPVYSIGLANEDCNMHAVGENFRIDLIKKGLEFSEKFFGN